MVNTPSVKEVIMNKFITNSFVKVKVNAKKVKPHLRDKPYKIIRCIGEIVPFHYLVEDADLTILKD